VGGGIREAQCAKNAKTLGFTSSALLKYTSLSIFPVQR